ncbi:MAG TPA: HAD family hydrolase [Thermoanaerobaculia bacterium]|nr:HAD family hydrolase [Thermoanaerobaculia bacterium]
MERPLVIFDVDGTLADSVELDDRVYRATLASVYGLDPGAGAFAAFRNVTDSGILEDLFLERFGRGPSPAEVHTFVRRFGAAITRELSAAGCRPIAGAGRLLDALRQSSRWRVELATGGFSATARLKLAAAGIVWERWFASADDALSREEIVALAMARGGGSRVSTVLVGDAAWDARTARRLGIAFVGVAPLRTAARLRVLGAEAVVPDFRERRRVLEILEAAVQRGPVAVPAAR